MDNALLELLNETCVDMVHLLAKNEAEDLIIDRVVEENPVKFTPYLKKLILKYDSIAKQFLPSPQEAKTHGTATPFEEGKKTSLVYGLERVYRDRVLLTPHFDCPAYCRFCYKKSRVMRNRKSMTYDEIDRAVFEIRKMQDVRGALITGGDPFMDPSKLFYMLDLLIALSNIHEIRIGTRMLLNSPHVFTDEVCDHLADYIRPDFSDPSKSKYLAINVHFNHPDELQPEVLQACHKLTSRGITLRNQTVLLKGINDDAETMKQLFHLLLRNNIIIYYMNHCMPVAGSDHLRTTVQKGTEIYKELCTESSCSIPHYVFAPSGGKVHVGPDSVYDRSVLHGLNMLNVKLLYKAEEFRTITKKDLPSLHYEAKDGYIKGYYIDGNDD